MFGPTTHKVVKGWNQVPCLLIKTPTGRRATHDGLFQDACTRIYVGILKPPSIGKDARTLRFQDLYLGKFIEDYNEETGQRYFEMELPHPGEYAFVMESNKLEAPDGVLYIGTQFTSHSDGVKPPLLYPLDGEPHFKVAEELTAAENEAGKEKKHYVCTGVESKEGQAPEMQGRMDDLEIKGVKDWDVVEFHTSLFYHEYPSKLYRSGVNAKGAGGSTCSVRGEPDKHAVIIGESEHTAVQKTRASKAKLLSECSIKVRMHVKQLEAPEAPTVSEGEVGVAPRIIKRKTSDNVIANLQAQMYRFASKEQYEDAADVKKRIAELKKINDELLHESMIKKLRAQMYEFAEKDQFEEAAKVKKEIAELENKKDAVLHEAKRRKGTCSNSLADEGCASEQRNYMPGATMLLAKSEEQPPADEVHDFEGSCNWNIQIIVKEHDGKDDLVGERVDNSNVMTQGNFRRYKVKAGQHIKVTLKNLSPHEKIRLKPVYKGVEGEDPEDYTDIEACCGEYELPYPLEKSKREEEDFWLLKDEQDKTRLTLGFVVE